MRAATPVTLDAFVTSSTRPSLHLLPKAGLALACVCAGVAPLAMRGIDDALPRVSVGFLLAAAYLAFAMYARSKPLLRAYWELPFAFFIVALVQALNNAIPGFVGSVILRDPPNGGNPLASTISGTVTVQLVEMLVAVVPIIALTRLSGSELGSIYLRRGVVGRWLGFSIVFFVAFYVFVATIPLRPGGLAQQLLPTNGAMSVARFVALSPALLVISLSNGFEEELLFRGLFLEKYNWLFGAVLANVVQALVFSLAHTGVTYTPSAIVFILFVVFPLGLFAGYLMRATKSVITPVIFHGALDMAIYLAFLSYASS